ncbi:MAG: hypothetical protein Q7J56_03710 [Deltaproteobacteria bacterium]|nr:hypothetical protein [Deltaproteobacteria bacterium]
MPEKKNGGTIQSITLLIAAAGLAVGAWQYWDSNRQQYRKEIWSAQKKLYEQAVTSASAIANGERFESVAESRKAFWALYWGNLAVLESRSVENAMIEFGNILGNCESSKSTECFQYVPGNRRTALQRAALDLAHCARESLRNTWEPVDIGDLAGKCPYSSAVSP